METKCFFCSSEKGKTWDRLSLEYIRENFALCKPHEEMIESKTKTRKDHE